MTQANEPTTSPAEDDRCYCPLAAPILVLLAPLWLFLFIVLHMWWFEESKLFRSLDTLEIELGLVLAAVICSLIGLFWLLKCVPLIHPRISRFLGSFALNFLRWGNKLKTALALLLTAPIVYLLLLVAWDKVTMSPPIPAHQLARSGSAADAYRLATWKSERYPALVDEASMLSYSEQAALATKLGGYNFRHRGRRLSVKTMRSLGTQSLDAAAGDILDEASPHRSDGIVILVVRDDKKMRVAFGHDMLYLQASTDEFLKAMRTQFMHKSYAAGINAGVDEVILRTSNR
ncbi:MAG: TPM domain-containing protein [Thermomonas sp.]